MITLKELLGPYNFSSLPESHRSNLMDLLERCNRFRQAYAKPMRCTSGYRSEADQRRIYAAKGVTGDKVPMGSCHLKGAAADFADPDGSMAAWAKANEALLEKFGLWIEDPAYTKGWLHMQTQPPKSGKRFFKP